MIKSATNKRKGSGRLTSVTTLPPGAALVDTSSVRCETNPLLVQSVSWKGNESSASPTSRCREVVGGRPSGSSSHDPNKAAASSATAQRELLGCVLSRSACSISKFEAHSNVLYFETRRDRSGSWAADGRVSECESSHAGEPYGVFVLLEVTLDAADEGEGDSGDWDVDRRWVVAGAVVGRSEWRWDAHESANEVEHLQLRETRYDEV